MLWSRQHDYYSQTLLTKLIRKAGEQRQRPALPPAGKGDKPGIEPGILATASAKRGQRVTRHYTWFLTSKLASGWRVAVEWLASGWRVASEQLASSWRAAADKRLASGWRAAGERLASGWRAAGERLASGWRAACKRLASGLRAASERLAMATTSTAGKRLACSG